MRSHIVSFLLLPSLAIAQTQKPPARSSYEDKLAASAPAYSPQLTKELVQIRDAALADDYAYRQVEHLCDSIGPRPEGSPQAQAAVEYVAGELRKLGLEVRLEDVMVPKWVRGQETAELVDYPGKVEGTTQKIVLTAISGNKPTPREGIIAGVVIVNSFDELKSLGREKVAGKIVLYNVPYDQKKAAMGASLDAYGEAVIYRGMGAKRAEELGAVASLIRSVGNADYRIPHTGWSARAGIPAGAVTAEDAGLIARLAAEGPVRMHLVLTSYTGDLVPSYNVIGDLKGSEHPEQVVIVSGHLDSWDLGTGAIDDAAGVAVAMETAEVLALLHSHPKRTIRVVAWMDEENGGEGHDAYVRAHAKELANHVGAIESDDGAGHPLGFRAIAKPAALPMLQPMLDVLRTIGANLMQPSDDAGADIEPLAKAGVPAFGVNQDGRTYFNYHHTPADTLDKIVPQELRENAAAMAVLAYTLAELPEPLPR
jgi:carboxypeptidase Q